MVYFISKLLCATANKSFGRYLGRENEDTDLERASVTLSLPAATVADMSETRVEPLAATFSNLAAMRSAVRPAVLVRSSVMRSVSRSSWALMTWSNKKALNFKIYITSPNQQKAGVYILVSKKIPPPPSKMHPCFVDFFAVI